TLGRPWGPGDRAVGARTGAHPPLGKPHSKGGTERGRPVHDEINSIVFMISQLVLGVSNVPHFEAPVPLDRPSPWPPISRRRAPDGPGGRRSRDAARRKCRPGLFNLEDRLPPNNLGALGDLLGAAAASAAWTRPASDPGDTPPAASNAAVSRGSQATVNLATA